MCGQNMPHRITYYALHAPVQEMQLELRATVFDTLFPCHKADMKASAKREKGRESCVTGPGNRVQPGLPLRIVSVRLGDNSLASFFSMDIVVPWQSHPDLSSWSAL